MEPLRNVIATSNRLMVDGSMLDYKYAIAEWVMDMHGEYERKT